jgi:hypothetical protein
VVDSEAVAPFSPIGLVSVAQKPRCVACVARLGLGEPDWAWVLSEQLRLKGCHLSAEVGPDPRPPAPVSRHRPVKVRPFEEVAGEIPPERW